MQKRRNIFQWQVKLALSFVLILVDLAASGQTVSNVTAEQQGNALLIHYILLGSDFEGFKRSFAVDADIYDISQSEVSEFLKDFPEAREVISYIWSNDTVNVPIDSLQFFLRSHANAEPLYYQKNGSDKISGDYEVCLFVSADYGKSWKGPLIRVSGDVGKGVSAGANTIYWEVLEEMEQLVGSGIQFKVVASSNKPYEPEMVFVKGGTFMMGSNNGEADEKPVHQVTLSDFYIGKYEVTQAQWRAMMGSNPSYFVGCDECPVEQVSLDDVQQFITKLNKITGKNYRLPTEAEWEYAARGGNQSLGHTFSGSNDIGSVAWYDANGVGMTHIVGQKQANELGVYDMSGNVWEWCSDWYGPYPSFPEVNPSRASSDRLSVIRGGSWYDFPQHCRIALRDHFIPNFRRDYLGFRLVLIPER